ncbi:MAG TPA: hypothetical protein VLI40_03865 [Gemmatimonadaceae bacterium]|nr:hypothetical protein [Gemmatimonadaceae bacterium]
MSNRFLIAVVAATALTASTLHGQGSLSSQGLGYPPGELSTRALGTAGAVGEIDARSPINPAALAIRTAPQVYAQYDPEFRKITSNGQTSSTTLARMPNIGGVLPLNGHLVLGLSASTFLDRTWETARSRTQPFGPNPGDTVAFNETLKSEGAITDVRLALAYAVNDRLRFGVGVHTFPGSMRLTSNEIFPDTTKFQNITQLNQVSFSGRAVSVGMEAALLPTLSVAISGRKGGTARMFANDSLLTTGTIPTRYSGSLAFTGIPGTMIAARASHETWSELDGLSYAHTLAVDANDVSLGVESSGPRIGGGFPILVRLGVRRRTLPFAVGTEAVQETSFGGGIGIPIAFDRVTLDMALLHEARTGVAGVSEHGYNLSFGLQVHP